MDAGVAGGSAVVWVLHVDLDEFIAAAEVLRHPELAGRPVIVGGRGVPTERGVVATASYAAREWGVHSGMPLRAALRRAPEGIFLAVDHEYYEAVSARVMSVVRGLDAPVEVLGWDEAFLGVRTTHPEAWAGRIQREVLVATGLHCSVGIGDNKVRAKNATGFAKPRGTFRLTRENWLAVMGGRPTAELWGVGKRVAARLARHGIDTVAQLALAPLEVLTGEFGPNLGRWYAALGRGVGSAEVDGTPRVARGHSRETTFQSNLTSAAQIAAALRVLAEAACADAVAEGRDIIRVTVKVRYAPFLTRTMSRKLAAPTGDCGAVVGEALALAGRIEPGREVRLLGVRVELDPGDAA